MTIRTQSLLSIAIATLLLLGGAMLTLRLVLQSRFDSLEEDVALRDAERARSTLMQAASGLHTVAEDWANWNATYEFIDATGEARREYITDTLNDAALAANGIHALAFLDTQGRMVWSGGWDTRSQMAVALPQGIQDALASSPALQAPPRQGLRGVLSLPEGPIFLSVHSIHTSEYAGQSRGTLLMGRHVVGAMLETVQRLTMLDMTLEPLPAGNASLDVQLIPEGETMRIIAPVEDLLGEPAIGLAITMPRTIMARGREAIVSTMAAVLVCGVILALVIQWLLVYRILSRIRSVGEQTRRLAGAGVHGQQIFLQGNDEIATLATSINSMLGALEAGRRTQQEQYEALQREEQFLEAVLDTLHAGIVQIDPETHTILEINAFAEQLAGRPRGELKGGSCHGFLCPTEVGNCPITDRGESVDLAVRTLVDVNGNHIPVLKSVTSINRHGRDILLETFVDVTELQEAQEKLRLSEETYRTIFTSTGAALAMLDNYGHIALANDEFARIAGVPIEVLERARPHWSQFFPLEAQAGMQAMLLHSQERIANLESEFLAEDGSSRHVSFTVADLPQPGWHIISLLDITSRRQVEAALQGAHATLEQTVAERTQELELAVRQLKELDSMKSSFLSSASHELRTPLTSIMGFAKLMERSFKRTFLPLATTTHQQERANEHLRNLRIMQNEGERLTRLVNDLLDLNAIESGSMQWQVEPVEMGELLRSAVDALGSNTMQDGVTLHMDLASHLPTFQADPERLRQLFHNLLTNAAKFTDSGWIRLHAVVNHDLKTLDVSVQDTGQGIAPDYLEHIFDRFYQRPPGVDPGDHLRDKPRGAGLGLTICREIVDHYDGALSATSTLGHGTTFTVRLPLSLETTT